MYHKNETRIKAFLDWCDFLKEQTRKVVKISLYNQDKRVTAVLPQANYMNTSPYGDDTEFHYDTDIDLAVDEKGLWAIYATESNQGSIVVSK